MTRKATLIVSLIIVSLLRVLVWCQLLLAG